MNIVLVVPILFAFLIAASFVYHRNRIVRLKFQVNNALGSIEAMLKKRHDLVPNLVSAVQAEMGYERDLLTRVTELRATAMSPRAQSGERMDAEGELSKALTGILVAVENYPRLKANENVLQLQAALNEAEEQIAAARRFYNTAVTAHNTALETFPSNLVAGLLRYRPREVFRAPDDDRRVPDVGRLFGG